MDKKTVEKINNRFAIRKKTLLDKLTWVRENHSKIGFYKMLEVLSVNEVTLRKYHERLGLKLKKECFSTSELACLFDDYFSGVSIEYILKVYDKPNILIFKELQKKLVKMKNKNENYKLFNDLIKDGLTYKKAWHKIDLDLYNQKSEYI